MLEIDDAFHKVLENRLCPDFDGINSNSTDPETRNGSFYKVMNSYTNEQLRRSFSVEIWTCNSVLDKNCRTDSQITDFLNNFYFTMFTTNEKAEFTKSNLNKRPVSIKDTVHS